MKLKTALYLTLAILIVGILNFPVIWITIVSFKPTDLIFKAPTAILFRPTLEHFANLMAKTEFFRYLHNSLVVAAGSALFTLLLSFPAAFSVARFKTGGEDFAFWLMTLRITPPIVFVIPLYALYLSLNLLDEPLGLILIYQTFNVPLAVWVLRSFLEELPRDYEEAAQVDGASLMQAMVLITLRMALPALVAVGVLSFVAAWNEYLYALVLTITRTRTWAVGSQVFVGTYEIQWGELAAAGVVGMIPPLILTYLIREHLVRGLTLGALKG
jgi:multiple sugar transport system permease protein